MFESILNQTSGSLSINSAAICIGVSAVLGMIIALVHMTTSRYTKNFIITLALLPMLVQVVIMMVNGNLGTSVAVLGAFSLVRFRSLPGNSREIISIFFAMAVGLAVGMGQITFAVSVTVIISLLLFVFSKTKFGEKQELERNLKIMIPENLDYTTIFDDIFAQYMAQVVLDRVKTTNMGTMYELTYQIVMKKGKNEKELMDEIRCRNGNLTVVLARVREGENEL